MLTERFIAGKPEELRFCKVVSILCLELWSSQLIVFYDQDYYERFLRIQDGIEIWISLFL